MIKRRILLQETATGRKIVAADEDCARCPGACFRAPTVVKEPSSSIEVAVHAATLNRLAVMLFGTPLLLLILLVLGLDAVTNAYPLLQVFPLQLGILTLLGVLMVQQSRVLKSRLLAEKIGLKELTNVPTMAERELLERLELPNKT